MRRFLLFLLRVNRVLLGYWVEFGSLVLLARVFFVFVVKSCVVHVTFTNAVFVALGNQFDE